MFEITFGEVENKAQKFDGNSVDLWGTIPTRINEKPKVHDSQSLT